MRLRVVTTEIVDPYNICYLSIMKAKRQQQKYVRPSFHLKFSLGVRNRQFTTRHKHKDTVNIIVHIRIHGALIKLNSEDHIFVHLCQERFMNQNNRALTSIKETSLVPL